MTGEGKLADVFVVPFLTRAPADDVDLLTLNVARIRRKGAVTDRRYGQTEKLVRQYGAAVAGDGAQDAYAVFSAQDLQMPVA